MLWFGEPWPDPADPAPVCADPAERVSTPVGMRCGLCDSRIAEADQGVVMGHLPLVGPPSMMPVHVRCLLRDVLGPTAAL